MTDHNMIPADQWPEWADRHCWDENEEGHFYGTEPDTGIWMECTKRSNIPMPTGWDWRVPVMRPVTAAKGGEQIADIVADWDANRCGPFKAMKRIKKHLDSLTFQPGNDLHIGYEAGMKLARRTSANDLMQLRKTVADAMNFIAHFSWAWNGTGQHPNTIRTDLQSLLALIDLQADPLCVKKLADCQYPKCGCSDQPTKGEGVQP